MLIDWYFDFISPFSYLQLPRILAPPPGIEVRFRPVLLAPILEHVGQLGPAEIPSKRCFTYRYVVWRARRDGIPLRFPPAHPFNSLRMLRLAIAAGSTPEAVKAIFGFTWREGRLPDDEPAWQEFVARAGLQEADKHVGDPDIKQRLRADTEAAIAAGVFGVPTCVVADHVFWGSDATDMVFDFCRNPGLFAEPEMQRVSNLPVSAARPRRSKPASAGE